MAKLTILRGISGSGKSTWARQQNGVVVSRDALRVMMFGSDKADYYAVDKSVLSNREQQVTVACNALIAAHLKAGTDVIVDNTNIEWKYVKQIAKIGYRYNAEVEVKVFDVDLQDAIDRDHLRGHLGGRTVGANIIKSQHERFKKNKSKTLEPVQAVKPYTGTPGKPKAFLVDIDGTLAHMRDYRGPFDWAKVSFDDADEVIVELTQRLHRNGLLPVIMSGRDSVCREETEEWLDFWGVSYVDLFMRPEKDMRPDNVIKAELFDKYVRDHYDVQFVLDDRDQVVDMWRRMGLKCLQVENGDF